MGDRGAFTQKILKKILKMTWVYRSPAERIIWDELNDSQWVQVWLWRIQLGITEKPVVEPSYNKYVIGDKGYGQEISVARFQKSSINRSILD